MDILEPKDGPELVIALAGAVGTDLHQVGAVLQSMLSSVGYSSAEIRLSATLKATGLFPVLSESFPSEYDRIRSHMKAGSKLRKRTGRGDALALLSIANIAKHRDLKGSPGEPIHKHAFILNSIKNPEEISTLRDIYGRAFHVLSVYSNREVRKRNLSEKIASSVGSSESRKFEPQAAKLMLIDEEEGHSLGQRLGDAYALADYFVDGRNLRLIEEGVSRFVELLFDNSFRSPTPDEFGMFQAYSSALRSVDLGRQVGASISDGHGNILSVGCNEVPKAFGGQYWESDSGDQRDFQKGYDSNVLYRKQAVSELLNRMRAVQKKIVKGKKERRKSNKWLEDLSLALQKPRALSGLRLESIIEYGRAVHAEMAALMDATRRGVRVDAATMYTTTFPCHLCARHILAAGIRSVVYIEPYPKNQVEDLYSDSIVVDPATGVEERLVFRSFVGVAPRSYAYLFQPNYPLKEKGTGKVIPWTRSSASPRLKRYVNSYMMIEDGVIAANTSLLESYKGKI